ncbi:hypothetical protein [Arenimonas oryziterrae]|uniref:Uncharacterized protein n=1 Tax=Arenimonas oryziterrae DSM 21050 = YC6267 TaxID=1121015 RepID=A0A091ATV6_9GAMM|nr:hypothetical protein [Arenimonas oryziterrae]KFN43623.1 hypothetical protein N789_10125 [Arenimonas oryziterrae DSM 21050 = YC6267]
MSWSGEQQRLLGAMGYTLYQRAGVAVAPVAPMADSDAPAATAAPASAGKLLQALQRAANGRDIAALITDLEALRRDPRGKRTLWPQLRALRRGH